MNLLDFPITIGLIICNVIVSMISFSNADWYSKATMWPYGVKRYKQYYRFITSGFIHADFMHLFFNMITLYFFGRVIEIYFSILGLGGSIAYLVLYFVALIVSDLPTYFKQNNNYNYHSLGASGAVSAVLFAAIVFDPWAKISLYGVLGLSALLYAVLYIIYCVVMSKKQADNINHDAHLWGSIFGAAFTIALIGALNPEVFELVLQRLKEPAILGR